MNKNNISPRRLNAASKSEFETGLLLKLKISKYKNHTTLTISYKRPSIRLPSLHRLNILPRRLAGPIFTIIGTVGVMTLVMPYFNQSYQPNTQALSSALTSPNEKPKKQAKKIYSLPYSKPLEVHAPSIGLSAKISETNIDGSDELLAPANYDIAAWYIGSPTPGEIGPAVLVGHLNSFTGAAVFSNIKNLATGSKINILRTDSKDATFTVTKLLDFPQNAFPSQEVYGNTLSPELRLITCSGEYNYLTGRYNDNTVVFAKLDEPKAKTNSAE